MTAQRLLRGQDGADFARLNLLISLAACSRYLQRYSDAINLLEQVQALATTTLHWRVEDLQVQRALLWTELGAWRAADDAFAAIEANRQLPPPIRAGMLIARATYQLARNIDAKATVAEAEKLAAAIERAVQRQTAGAVKNLSVEVHKEGVLLKGRCDTYYCKQLAQHAAMRFPAARHLTNEIEVS